MQAVDYFPDGDNRIDLDAIVLPQLIQSGTVPGTPLHPVHGDEQGADVHVRHMLEQFDGLPNSGASGDDILHDGDVVTRLRLIAHHNASFAVVLGLFAIEAVGQVPPIIAV